MASKGDQKLTKHHIVPRSRNGANDRENISYIKQGLHRRYHDLFKNKTPSEILSFLENYFWGKDEQHLIRYYWRKENET